MEQKGNEKIVSVDKEPFVKLAEGLVRVHKCDGICAYYGKGLTPATIILELKSNNISSTLIHECIHASLHIIGENPSMEKLAHKLNRREDFVELLTGELATKFNFIIS